MRATPFSCVHAALTFLLLTKAAALIAADRRNLTAALTAGSVWPTAYIIDPWGSREDSTVQSEALWRATEDAASTAGFSSVWREGNVGYDLPALQADAALLEQAGLGSALSLLPDLSRLFTHRRAWRRIAVDDSIPRSHWVLILEKGSTWRVGDGTGEGADVSAFIRAVHSGTHSAMLELSGVILFGASQQDSAAECESCAIKGRELTFECRRCLPQPDALHAYAVQKWRATWLYDELQSHAGRRGSSSGSGCVHAGISRYWVCSTLPGVMREGYREGLPWPIAAGGFFAAPPSVHDSAVPAPSHFLGLARLGAADLPVRPTISTIPIIAYVISLDDGRWERMKTLLVGWGCKPKRVIPVPYVNTTAVHLHGEDAALDTTTDKFMYFDLSNLFSHRLAWARIEADEEVGEHGYALVFEDDVELHEKVAPQDVPRIVHETAAQSSQAGVFYLSLCWSIRCHSVANAMVTWQALGLMYGRCVGRCLHAYGVHKWRAGWLYDHLRAYAAGDHEYTHTKEYPVVMDALLDYGLQAMLEPEIFPALSGMDLNEHDFGGAGDEDLGTGIVYQARKLFPSGRSI